MDDSGCAEDIDDSYVGFMKSDPREQSSSEVAVRAQTPADNAITRCNRTSVQKHKKSLTWPSERQHKIYVPPKHVSVDYGRSDSTWTSGSGSKSKHKYGWWCLTPFCLQRLLNNAKAFVLFVTMANVLQGVICNGLLKVNVTSIERRYKLLSSESGLIISSFDIAGCLCLLPISYIGGRGHKPRWISVGVLMLGLGSVILAMPRFLVGPYVYERTYSSSFSEDNESALCHRGAGNTTNDSISGDLDPCDGSHSNDAYLKQMKYVFMLGQFFNGIGNTPLGVLAVTFIDESVNKRVYPIYIGVYYLGALIGPAIGFVLGGQLLTTFTNLDEKPTDITPESPMWVGAWWVGFIIAGSLTILVSIPLFGYPRKLNAHPRKRKKHGMCYSPWWWKCLSKSPPKSVDASEEIAGKYYPKPDPAFSYNASPDEPEFQPMMSPRLSQTVPDVRRHPPLRQKSSTVLVTDFFKDIVSIVSNRSFIFLSLSAAIYSTLVSGFSTFGPKFIESQLGKSAADAANLFGYVCIPAGAGGMLIGAFLMTGLKMNHKSALQMCIGVSLSGLLAHFVLVLNCDDLSLAGVTVPYNHNVNAGISDYHGLMLNVSSPCNAECSCSTSMTFHPVCGDNGITYYSPCHAGCSSKNIGPDKVYGNCSCVQGQDSNSATPRKCGVSCRWQNLILFSLFIVILTTFMCTVPGVDLSLRCFPYRQRPLAVGVQWVLIRTLGSIPGPIIFGAMIDGTCMLWGKTTCAGDKGSCLMYKNSELSSSFLVLSVIYKAAGIVALCIALVYIQRDTVETTSPQPSLKIVELPMSSTSSNQQSTSRGPVIT